MDWYDVLERSAWTAVQAFVGALSASEVAQAVASVDLTALESLAFSGLGAAVAALLSFLKTLAQERLQVLDTRSVLVQVEDDEDYLY